MTVMPKYNIKSGPNTQAHKFSHFSYLSLSKAYLHLIKKTVIVDCASAASQ